jgi:uncharacterized membrane protein
MFAIYLIVAAIIIAITFYYAGQWERPEKGYSFWDGPDDILMCGVGIAIIWPIVLTLVIIIGPFALLYYLGVRKKAKRKNNNS